MASTACSTASPFRRRACRRCRCARSRRHSGLSLCLRLLALVDLLATAPWASRYLATDRGLRIGRHLLRAAARADLTEEARFDEASFCRNLSPPPNANGGGGAFTGVSA